MLGIIDSLHLRRGMREEGTDVSTSQRVSNEEVARDDVGQVDIAKSHGVPIPNHIGTLAEIQSGGLGSSQVVSELEHPFEELHPEQLQTNILETFTRASSERYTHRSIYLVGAHASGREHPRTPDFHSTHKWCDGGGEEESASGSSARERSEFPVLSPRTRSARDFRVESRLSDREQSEREDSAQSSTSIHIDVSLVSPPKKKRDEIYARLVESNGSKEDPA